jgi:hypothetical protein
VKHVSIHFVKILVLRVAYHTYRWNGVKKFTLYLLQWYGTWWLLITYMQLFRLTICCLLHWGWHLERGSPNFSVAHLPLWSEGIIVTCQVPRNTWDYHVTFPQPFWNSETNLEILETSRCDRWPASTFSLCIQMNEYMKGKTHPTTSGS